MLHLKLLSDGLKKCHRQTDTSLGPNPAPPTPLGTTRRRLTLATSDIFGLERARSVDAERAIEAADAFAHGDMDELPAQLKTM